MACQVLRKARLLRLKKGFKSVYMCPDRTFEERQAHKKLLQELKLKHAAYPDKFFAIRNNEVVSVSKNSFPAHGVELLFAFSWLTFRKCFHGSQFILCLLCSGAIWMRSWIFLHLPVFGYPVKYTFPLRPLGLPTYYVKKFIHQLVCFSIIAHSKPHGSWRSSYLRRVRNL